MEALDGCSPWAGADRVASLSSEGWSIKEVRRSASIASLRTHRCESRGRSRGPRCLQRLTTRRRIPSDWHALCERRVVRQAVLTTLHNYLTYVHSYDRSSHHVSNLPPADASRRRAHPLGCRRERAE